ncbi:MAG: hypothetical protein I3273_00245 [Candidatus Moeniiplasma glomeromycotorum]|nr:hypothetical protein [Candidatus Moeniiplasma glomeromycotorum]MCE8167441.1 hypothetical protein [Candidatus Moeniiplasma glomeromycotorum]MCE8168545.1 hypothetical protein [Candidatus Moeniiplasma glomeromycotorum]
MNEFRNEVSKQKANERPKGELKFVFAFQVYNFFLFAFFLTTKSIIVETTTPIRTTGIITFLSKEFDFGCWSSF